MTIAPFALKTSRRRARISLTPLIDVVFILLFFFMLTSTFTDRFVLDLETPSVVVGIPMVDDIVVVEITIEGIKLNGALVMLDSLAREIALTLRHDTDLPVAVTVGPEVPLSALTAVIDTLSGAGLQNVSLSRLEKI